MGESVLADADQRARVATDLDATLFVEAGAGSGKTTALVGRLVALVESGIELRTIAAITFTEKAGAELRDRLRRELERRVEQAPPSAVAVPDLEAVTRAAFGQRRKMVRQSLKSTGMPVEVLLAAAGLRGDERAEELPVSAYLAMAKAYAKR